MCHSAPDWPPKPIQTARDDPRNAAPALRRTSADGPRRAGGTAAPSETGPAGLAGPCRGPALLALGGGGPGVLGVAGRGVGE